MIYPFKLEKLSLEELKKEYSRQIFSIDPDPDKCMACENELEKRGELV